MGQSIVVNPMGGSIDMSGKRDLPLTKRTKDPLNRHNIGRSVSSLEKHNSSTKMSS